MRSHTAYQTFCTLYPWHILQPLQATCWHIHTLAVTLSLYTHTLTTRACWCISKQTLPGTCPPCAASCCRFIVNYMGNKSVALSPDIPHHALRPLRINCHAPAAKFVVGTRHRGPADHTDGSSYAATAPCSRVATGCLLSVCWEYQQVSPCVGGGAGALQEQVVARGRIRHASCKQSVQEQL